MVDLDKFIISAKTLDDININTDGLPITNGMLVWHGLAFAESSLKNYLVNAPEKEKNILDQIQILIAESQQSTRQAFSSYPKLIACIENWYQQKDLRNINYTKAIILLKSVDYVLKALAHDCHAISWPMSNWIPSSLFSKVSLLLDLGKNKIQLLHVAKQNHNNNLNPAPQEISALYKLKLTLDQGILNLMNKTSIVAEKKDSYEYLLNQFKELEQCFSESPTLTMENFWNKYSEPKLFHDLMDSLLLNDSEKTPWLRAYQYHKINKPSVDNIFSAFRNTLGSLYNMTSYGILGVKLEPKLLKQRMDQAVELLYQQVIDEKLQHKQSNQWLKQIEQTLDHSEKNPLLSKLLSIQKEFKNELPTKELKIENKNSRLLFLLNKASFTTQTRIADVSKIRYQLQTLLTSINELKTKLQLKYIESQELIKNINLLRQLTDDANFKLTNININNFLKFNSEILKKINQDFINQLPQSFINISTTQLNEIYQQCDDELAKQIAKLETVINDFNSKGSQLRQASLEQLAHFINKQQGLLENIFRFFSPSYRKCMVEIESILRSNCSSLEKVDNITQQLFTAQSRSFYCVSQRLKNLSAHNKYGLFETHDNSKLEVASSIRHSAPELF